MTDQVDAQLPQDEKYKPISVLRPTTDSVSVEVTGSTGFLPQIGPGIVRVSGSVKFHVVVEGEEDATTDNAPCAADSPEYFHVRDGDRIAVIKADGGADGTVWATVMK